MKKPWPSDAVMIVASIKGTEIRDRMEGVCSATCRDCGAELACDTYTQRVAEGLTSRRGRPVRHFCPPCAITYRIEDIQELHDHAGITTAAGGEA